MNSKILAIAIVAIIAVGGVAAYLAFSGNGGSGSDDSGMRIVGRVNSEGSGIILVPGEEPTDYITVQKEMPGLGAKYIYNEVEGNYYVLHPENWGGKIFGTPGAATIQHVQLAQVVKDMGLNYTSYMLGTELKADTVYYVAGVTGFEDFMNKMKTTPFTGYFTWEAQYSAALAYEAEIFPSLVMTNNIFPDHTCCIIGTNAASWSKNSEALEVFLKVYVDAVNEINVALNDTSSADYATLLQVATKRVVLPDALTPAEKTEAYKSALQNVTYVYADSDKGSLNDLRNDIAAIAESLYNSGQIGKSASDLGFNSYADLAKKFVDSKYMEKALSGDVKKLEKLNIINVAVISGDIHQIAMWYAIEKGMFEEYNLEINTFAQGNGPAVFTLLENGEANIGFLGAPPMTINSMNKELITA